MIDIIYEDEQLLAVNKPAGLASQPDRSGDASAAVELGRENLYAVHRLDRPASGLLLFAKSREAAAALSGQFREGTVKRLYWAVAEAAPPAEAGELRHWLKHDGRANKTRAFDSLKQGALEARLRYRLAGRGERYFFVEIELITGRTHQIRAQLAAAGLPIKGDLKYGARRSNPGGGIHLHCRLLAPLSPSSGRELRLAAPPPDDALWRAFLAAEGAANP